MSSSKKKKNTALPEPAKENTAPAKQEKAEVDEADIPVQSLSDMLSFAYEAEEEFDSMNASKTDASETDASGAAESEAPVTEEPKPEKKDGEKPVQLEKKEPAKPAAAAPKSEPKKEAISAAEAALDRDLELAKKKRMREQAYEQHQREIEAKKEEERLARAAEATRHIKNAEANAAAIAEKQAAEKEAIKKQAAERTAAAGKTTVKKRIRNSINSEAVGKGAAVMIALLVLLYGGAFIYTSKMNEEYYRQLDAKLAGQSRSVTDISIPYTMSSLSTVSEEEKLSHGLELGLPDSDRDGLSDYYEINVSGTDPAKADSDGDGVNDGDEIISGLNPLAGMTDGETFDSDYQDDTFLLGADILAEITVKNSPKTAETYFVISDNRSIQGTPGIIGEAYDFYTDSQNDGSLITFTYTDELLEAWKTPVDALSIFRFNEKELSFDKVPSRIDGGLKKVSADITENGIYVLADSGIILRESNTQIFFLIDNSGSMYPEALCPNSEENDVEFKRLDFTNELIDMLKDKASFGAGEFLGNYTLISHITDDEDDIKAKVQSLRNKVPSWTGTDITGAINAAVSEFDAASIYDKNYIVLLTDGMPSSINEAYDKQVLKAARDKNITIFCIGLGKQIDAEYLFNIADVTNGQFFQASNADALGNIYSKIQNFMSYNQVIIEEGTEKKGFLVADSGLNAEKDGLAYPNFRTEFAPYGADFAIAGIIRDYYRGELPLTGSPFNTNDGTLVDGYDVREIEQFIDKKDDLIDLKLGILDTYNEYLALDNKWNYSFIRNGLLHYNDKTRQYVIDHNMSVITTPYTGTLEHDTGFIEKLKMITFHSLPDFREYENAIINSDTCTGDDLAIMKMFRYYASIPLSAKCRDYDFGYDGEKAYNALVDELTTGDPAVISFGGSAMNAVRLIREAEDPNKFVLEAYDSNNPGRITKIDLRKSIIYDGPDKTKATYQYVASINSNIQPLKLLVYNS